jgi:hypothetical protein
LSRPALEKLREPFTRKAEALIAELVARGSFDAVKDLSEAYPLSVFPDAMGLVKEGRENLLPYGNMAFNAFGPRKDLFEKSFEEARKVIDWIDAQCAREALAPDGLGAQTYAEADAGQASPGEAALLVRSLLTAGLDTTIFGIDAAAYCFATNLDQWRALCEDPALTRAAFEEVIRFISPVQTFFRTTTKSVEVCRNSNPGKSESVAISCRSKPRPTKMGQLGQIRHPAKECRARRFWTRYSHMRGTDGRPP